MQYLSPNQFAKRHGVSRQCVSMWLKENRIVGAKSKADPHGRFVWIIPTNAKRPAKEKTGRKPTKTLAK